MGFDVTKAAKELQEKTLTDIQVETCYTWGSRSVAAFSLFIATAKVAYYHDALEYYHEAIEHAALAVAGSGGKTRAGGLVLAELLRTVEPWKEKAEKLVYGDAGPRR
jgi:hypothetical protein